MNDKSEPLPPLWVSIAVMAGILVPPVIIVYMMIAYGWMPAGWAALAVILANTGSRAARQYFDR